MNLFSVRTNRRTATTAVRTHEKTSSHVHRSWTLKFVGQSGNQGLTEAERICVHKKACFLAVCMCAAREQSGAGAKTHKDTDNFLSR
jgi:hypothetical protein